MPQSGQPQSQSHMSPKSGLIAYLLSSQPQSHIKQLLNQSHHHMSQPSQQSLKLQPSQFGSHLNPLLSLNMSQLQLLSIHIHHMLPLKSQSAMSQLSGAQQNQPMSKPSSHTQPQFTYQQPMLLSPKLLPTMLHQSAQSSLKLSLLQSQSQHQYPHSAMLKLSHT
jgi:hypothetical protein